MKRHSHQIPLSKYAAKRKLAVLRAQLLDINDDWDEFELNRQFKSHLKMMSPIPQGARVIRNIEVEWLQALMNKQKSSRQKQTNIQRTTHHA